MPNKLRYLIMLTIYFNLSNDVPAQLLIDSGQNLGEGRIFSIVLGDLDGDNDSDAVVVNYLSFSKIWLNDGDGNFTDSGQSFGVPAERGHSAAIGDLDGDGDNDIFFVNNEGPNRVLLNNGQGIFTDSGQQLGSFAYLSVILYDMDGDNDLDAVLANALGSGEVWLNDGNGVFTNSGQNIGTNAGFYMGVADLDGDNDPDIFLNNNNAYDEVWFNDGIGNFTNSGQNIGTQQSWGRIALSDVDNDGDVDAFITNYESGISKVWVNDGQGTFSEHSSYTGNGEYVVMGDLDNDADVDAVTCGIEKNIKVWLNDGSGNFSYNSTLGYNGLSAYPADVDNDGDFDIAAGFMDGYGPNKIFLNQTITGLKGESLAPAEFNLIQNYPNPFNPTTKISYQIPVHGFVSLKVFDVLGNEIATIVNEEKSAGNYEVIFSALSLSSGIYFYQMKNVNPSTSSGQGFVETKKMLLLK